MMTEYARALVLTTWVDDGAGGYTAALTTLVDAADGDSFSIKVPDVDAARLVAQDTNLTLVEFKGALETAARIAELPDVVVLSMEHYDSDSDALLASDRDERPTAGEIAASEDGVSAVIGKGKGSRGALVKDGLPIIRDGRTNGEMLDELLEVITALSDDAGKDGDVVVEPDEPIEIGVGVVEGDGDAPRP